MRTGEPLPNTQLLVKGTVLRAASGVDGSYVIHGVPPGLYTVEARFSGYYSQEVKLTVVVDERATANFQLKPSVLWSSEVVTTGTGSGVVKRELTTPIAILFSPEIEMAPVESIDQLLQGRLPGTLINFSSGMPGAGARFFVRGVASLASTETPAIYIDGVRVANDSFRPAFSAAGTLSSALSDILVGDVARVEFVKGGAAATLYGSRAASGVIQIFTKKGQAGPPQWRFQVEQGYNQANEQFTIEDFTKRHILEGGHLQRYTFGLNGGGKVSTYNFSARMLNGEGNTQKLDRKMYALHGGLRVFATERLQLDFSSAFTYNDFDRISSGNAISNILLVSERGWFSPINQASPYLGFTDDQKLAVLEDYFSPDLSEAVNRFRFSTAADYSPSSWLQNRLTIGADYRKSKQRDSIPGTITSNIALFHSDHENLTITLSYAGTIRYPATGNITSAFTLGAQAFREEIHTSNASDTFFRLSGSDDFGNSLITSTTKQKLSNHGFFIDEQLGLFNRLYVNGGLLVDDDNAFGEASDLQAYPKAAVAYNLSDESFWQNSFLSKFWNVMKLRASWGKTGQLLPFILSPLFAIPGNDEIKPEKITGVDTGFDAAFFDERLGVEFSWFRETTKDALVLLPGSPVTGFGPQLRNFGEIQNDGIEVAVNAPIISTPKLALSLRAAMAMLDNRVTELNDTPPFTIGGFSFLPQRVEEGKPVGIFRTTHATGNGAIETRLEFTPLPKRTGSVALNATLFRNLSLSVLGDWQTGGYSLNTGALLRAVDGMKPEIDRIPPGHNFTTASSVFIEKSDYFKLREIVMRYQFRNVKYVRNLTMTASARNVYAFTSAETFDPELTDFGSTISSIGGINVPILSPPRTFRLGVEVNY
ncbi:TonB-dependent receptor [candidate division KSB1 bacterium]|nr:TonB-dependent receptor [candidate division KSB1 bacterium]